MEKESKGSQSVREVVTSGAYRPLVINATCETLTKEGKPCRRKCVLGEKSCCGHLKWEGECSICLEEFPNRELKCGHRFHRKCFERWKETVRKLGRQGSVTADAHIGDTSLGRRVRVQRSVEVTCPLCRSLESKHRVRGIEPFSNEFQGSLASEGIEALSNVLQMLLPFPAQMIEQMSENLWNQLEDDIISL